MKSAAVIFHSVYGNTLEMAKFYERAFLDEGFAVTLYRVEDYFLNIDGEKNPPDEKVALQMAAIPVIKDIELLDSYSAIAMGCPTRFAGVSASMKAFMDSFYYVKESTYLFAKYFLSFTSSSTHAAGGIEALIELNKFAMQMGMFPVPLPPKTQHMPAFGCLHYSGPYMSGAPDHAILMAIRSHVYTAACALTDDAELMAMIENIERYDL